MKQNKRLYILCLQSKTGQIINITHAGKYNLLLSLAMEGIKQPEVNYWTIFDNQGKYVDGNFPQIKENNNAG